MAVNKSKQQPSPTDSSQFGSQENTNPEFDGSNVVVAGETGPENNDGEDADGINKASPSDNGVESIANVTIATATGTASINDLINEINKNNTKRKNAAAAGSNKRPKRGGKFQDNMNNLYMNGLYPATGTSGSGQSSQQPLMAFPVPYATNAQGGYSYIGNSNMYQHVPSLVNDPRMLASIQAQSGDNSNNNMVPASTYMQLLQTTQMQQQLIQQMSTNNNGTTSNNTGNTNNNNNNTNFAANANATSNANANQVDYGNNNGNNMYGQASLPMQYHQPPAQKYKGKKTK